MTATPRHPPRRPDPALARPVRAPLTHPEA